MGHLCRRLCAKGNFARRAVPLAASSARWTEPAEPPFASSARSAEPAAPLVAAGEHLADFEDEFVDGFVGDDKGGGEDDEDAAPNVACGDGLSEYQDT